MKSKMNYSSNKNKNAFILFKRREEILQYNNSCLLNAVINYEKFFLDNIIRRTYFNDDSWNSTQLTKFLNDRMNFMDRFKLVREIANNNNIKNISQNKIEIFIDKRNKIAHNLSSITGYHTYSDEMDVDFGGESIEWKKYLSEIEKWATISLELAEFTKKVFQSINKISKLTVRYPYYNFEKKCILVPNMLYPDDLDIKISDSIENNINKTLLQLAIDEETYLEKHTL